jgi:thiol:disulfide interchange protein
MLLVGCGASTPQLPEPAHPERYWVTRTDAELDAVLAKSCTVATAESRPVLLVFSAPWCIDCRQMRALEQEDALAAERRHWQEVVVDVGRLDRHTDLLEAFRVSAIAHWVALAPDDCTQPATAWPVLRASTFEPRTGWFGAKTAPELRDWLVAARGG